MQIDVTNEERDVLVRWRKCSDIYKLVWMGVEAALYAARASWPRLHRRGPRDGTDLAQIRTHTPDPTDSLMPHNTRSTPTIPTKNPYTTLSHQNWHEAGLSEAPDKRDEPVVDVEPIPEPERRKS